MENNIVRFVPKFNDDHPMNETVITIVDSIINHPYKWDNSTHTFDGMGMEIWKRRGFTSIWENHTTEEVFSIEQGAAIGQAYDIWKKYNAGLAQKRIADEMKPKQINTSEGVFGKFLRFIGLAQGDK